MEPMTGNNHHFSLLADGRLGVVVEPWCLPMVERWLPRLPGVNADVGAGEAGPAATHAGVGPAAPPGAGPAASIRIHSRKGELRPAPAGEPTMRLGSAVAWVDGAGGRATLRGADPRVTASIDLIRLTAILEVLRPDPVGGEGADPNCDNSATGVGIVATSIVAGDLYSMLTVTAALLLGRLGRTPVHAGAVVTPSGGALLLAGDARAGKSTTCVNLIAAGWDYLSDDQVVLYRAGEDSPAKNAIWAEGWPRAFHLDEGWERGVSTGNRRDFDPTGIGGGNWRRAAPLEGLLFPVVRAEQPTRLTAITPADALARLIRQTPWLLVDRETAPELLALLSETARLPAHELSLGLDTYDDPERLSDRIAAPARA